MRRTAGLRRVRNPAFRLCAALVMGCAAHAACAVEPIDTEGPDFTDSAEVVPKGRFQVEVSPTWSRSREGPTDFSTPTLLRYGLREDWEVRIAPEGYVREHGAHGMGDTALGVKWHSSDGDAAKGLPALGWILHLELPTGAEAVRGRGVRPSLHATLAWDLPHEWDLGVMPGVEVDDDESGRRFAYGVLGVVAGKRITEKLRVFGEFSGERLTSSSHGGSVGEWDTGASYRIGTESLVGFRVATGVNRNSPVRSLVVELAHRF
jgi:hypothetical protein